MVTLSRSTVWWSGNSFLWSPSRSKSCFYSQVIDLASSIISPVLEYLGFSKGCNEDIPPGVSQLLRSAHISAIAWAVAFIVVFSIYFQMWGISMRQRPLLKSLIVCLPCSTYSYASSAVVLPGSTSFPIATADHTIPDSVQSANRNLVLSSVDVETRVGTVASSVPIAHERASALGVLTNSGVVIGHFRKEILSW